MRKNRSPVGRTIWTADELDADRAQSTSLFRRERLEEPLEEYLEEFEAARDAVETLLETTVDLAQLENSALEILTDSNLLRAFRYLAGPPISLDDLKVLVDTNSLSPQLLRENRELVARLLETIRAGLDRRRFPWVTDDREPTEAERMAATIASSALMAAQRVATSRRNQGKEQQEENVRRALSESGLIGVVIESRHIATVLQAPQPGQFCGHEVTLGDRKADLLVRLWDGRLMPIECKVSNSSTNSVKRLNNDAAVKAETWRKDFGDTQVVPVAVLSGVYKLHNLMNAQDRGLALYWAHRLTDLTNWIARTAEQ